MTDAKQWLSRGFWLRREKDQLERMREETITRLTKTTASGGDPVGGTKDPHKFDALALLDMDIDNRIRELDKVRIEIFTAIQQLSDVRYRTLLLGRYYECLSWGEVSAILHYDNRYTFKLHGQALQAIQPIIEERRNGAGGKEKEKQ